MASALYPSFKKLLLDGDIDLLVDTIKVALIDTGVYTYSASHDYWNDVTGVVGTPVTLTNKTTTGGAFDADDAVFTTVTGNTIEAVIVYKDTGLASTSPLIAYLDGFPPIPPNGSNITLVFSAINKIFTL